MDDTRLIIMTWDSLRAPKAWYMRHRQPRAPESNTMATEVSVLKLVKSPQRIPNTFSYKNVQALGVRPQKYFRNGLNQCTWLMRRQQREQSLCTHHYTAYKSHQYFTVNLCPFHKSDGPVLSYSSSGVARNSL